VWSVIAYHDWDGPEALETTLRNALDSLEGNPGGVLYDYVDPEAVVDVLTPGASRGATEIRFEFEGHEIRVARDGAIAAR
jgi:hypothetical protein